MMHKVTTVRLKNSLLRMHSQGTDFRKKILSIHGGQCVDGKGPNDMVQSYPTGEGCRITIYHITEKTLKKHQEPKTLRILGLKGGVLEVEIMAFGMDETDPILDAVTSRFINVFDPKTQLQRDEDGYLILRRTHTFYSHMRGNYSKQPKNLREYERDAERYRHAIEVQCIDIDDMNAFGNTIPAAMCVAFDKVSVSYLANKASLLRMNNIGDWRTMSLSGMIRNSSEITTIKEWCKEVSESLGLGEDWGMWVCENILVRINSLDRSGMPGDPFNDDDDF